MRRALILSALAFLVASVAFAQEAQFENDHYAVVLSKDSGGLIQSLTAKPSGDVVAQGMIIYTDYGVFDARAGRDGRYVGRCLRGQPYRHWHDRPRRGQARRGARSGQAAAALSRRLHL